MFARAWARIRSKGNAFRRHGKAQWRKMPYGRVFCPSGAVGRDGLGSSANPLDGFNKQMIKVLKRTPSL